MCYAKRQTRLGCEEEEKRMRYKQGTRKHVENSYQLILNGCNHPAKKSSIYVGDERRKACVFKHTQVSALRLMVNEAFPSTRYSGGWHSGVPLTSCTCVPSGSAASKSASFARPADDSKICRYKVTKYHHTGRAQNTRRKQRVSSHKLNIKVFTRK